MEKIIRNGIGIVGICACSLVVSSCSSGSLGSDVGDDKNVAPLAVAQVLNAGDTMTFRTGAEVLLTGKDSEDPDGPIIGYSWSGPAGVVLRERNSSTVAFTVPDVADGSQLTFTLTVTDSDNVTGQSTASITVKNALDQDRYLSMKLVSESADPNVFFVKPVLARAIGAGAGDATYAITVESFVIYPRKGSRTDCTALAGADPTDAEVNSGVMNGDGECLITRQSELATGNDQIAGAWPEDLDPGPNPWASPLHQLIVPRTDAGTLTPYPIAENARDRILELFAIPRSYHMVRAEAVPLNPAYLDEIVIGVRNRTDNGVLVETEVASGATVAWANVDTLLQNLNEAESVTSAEQYYNAVDPAGRRRTFNDWLCNSGFALAADCTGGQANGAVRLRPEATAGEDFGAELFAHATYLNNFDLGFGRDMYTRVNGETGYVYSFVNNYASLEGALRKATPIVAVVMEFSPPEDENGMPTSDVPFVKFFTYAPDGSGDMQLATSMNFDGRGELVTPGNCVACHGGTDPGTLDFAAGEVNTNATFLPWDVDSLLFMDTDPAIRDATPSLDGTTLLKELQALESFPGEFSSANQLTQIRRLNSAALATYTHENIDQARSQPAVDLLEHWYGPATTIQVGLQQRDIQVLNGNFSDPPPESWQTGFMVMDPADPGRIYTDVFAQNCRMCHTNAEETRLQFNSYDAMVDALGCYAKDGDGNITGFVSDSCADNVFNESKMPAARLTADRFWVAFAGGTESASEVLRAHLITTASNAGQVAFDIAPTPSAAANISFENAIINNSVTVVDRRASVTPVSLSGLQSNFASSFLWNVTGVDHLGQPFGSVPVAGDQSDTAIFVPDSPGVYTADLQINGDPASTVSAQLEVFNYLPSINDVQRAVDEDSGTITIDLVQETSFSAACDPQSRPDCPVGTMPAAQSPDAIATIQVSAVNNSNGSASCPGGSLSNCPSGVINYAPTVGPTYIDEFDVLVTDVEGDSAAGRVSVAFTQQLNVSATFAANSIYSDRDSSMRIDITGGAFAAAGGSRYRITCSARRLGGRLTGGLAGCGPNSAINTDAGTVNFVYESDQPNGNPNYRRSTSAADPEQFTITVTDSQGTQASAAVSFELRPQVRFNAASPAPFTFSIYNILRNGVQVANGDNCTRCHTSGGNAPNLAQSANAVYPLAINEARNTSGVLSVNSPLVCRPSNDGACNPPLSHSGGKILQQTGVNAIKRWINEGALRN